MRNNEVVILIHGFFKDESDMFRLKKHLSRLGYNPVTVNLPTRFGTLEDCTHMLQFKFSKILSSMQDIKKIHFVGHSMGGLIIRSFLANNYIPHLGRCVLIATPNHGTYLADLIGKYFSPALKIFKPLEALRTNKFRISKPLNSPQPEIGVIAGNKSNLLLGIFLSGENDGIVEVNSVKFESMKDFIVKNYGHKEIHYQFEIAELVDSFLQSGSFNGA